MRFADIPRRPDSRTLRQFAALFLLIFGGIAFWRSYLHGLSTGSFVLGAIALAVGLCGLIAPQSVRGVFVAYMYLAFPIGWLVSHLVLGAIFLLALTPVGLVFRIIGRDRLRRRRPKVSSYWEEKPSVDDPVQYYRQY